MAQAQRENIMWMFGMHKGLEKIQPLTDVVYQ
jgi:hypothetical protein